MSSLSSLVSELQALASETRRKHPDVREAADKSIAILRTVDPASVVIILSTDGPQATELLRPVFMACATKNAKVVAIGMASLQKLISSKAVPPSAVPQIVGILNDCVAHGVDIQLRILQNILGLVTNFPSVHGDLLGDALLLCFKLQESRIAVVSSTAAATLRQLVMFVMDKVVIEDKEDSPQQPVPTTLPDGTNVDLQPSSRDAFSVFEDLCLLANAERPHFLKLDQLHKTFALELIESVMTNYHTLFHRHNELLTLLPHNLCPLLLKCLSERPTLFPLALRATRVVFLILKQFSDRLTAESEIFLMLLVKVAAADPEALGSDGPRPPWMRVLAMEILRGVCADAELMRTLYTLHDQQSSSSQIFTTLLGTLNRLVSEKPALLGLYPQLQTGSTAGHEETYGTAAGMVSATVTGVVGMLAGGDASHGLSTDSGMRVQCIDQLDKAEAPSIPEIYIYLLALQSLTALCNGFSTSILPLYTSILSSESTNGVSPAPAALNLDALPASTPPSTAGILKTTHSMLEAGWPAFLAAHSFLIGTNLSTPLFQDVLGAIGALTQVCGVLGLSTPRDAFLGSLAKLAIPAKVVSSLDNSSGAEVMTPRSSVFADLSASLAGSSVATAPAGLGERNLACLKLFIACAMYLAGSLGKSWYTVLEALQNADYVLEKRALRPSAPTRRGSAVSGLGPTLEHATSTMAQLEHDADIVLAAMHKLFESSKGFEDSSFHDFVLALARLSAEMVAMQAGGGTIGAIPEEAEDESAYASPSSALQADNKPFQRRRVSGIHLSRTLRTGDFGITKLAMVAQLNLHRLVYHSPEVAWDPITSHLLGTLLNPSAPAPIRLQAAETLDTILAAGPKNVTMTPEPARIAVQARVLEVLTKQVTYGSESSSSSTTATEIRRMGLETLKKILETTGHTLLTGWDTIFEMLDSVCKPYGIPPTPLSVVTDISITAPSSPVLSPTTKRRPPSLLAPDKNVQLVRVAFQSLTLVCDFLPQLSPDNLRLCITTIAHYGRQTDTNIALTSAASLLWTVSDSIQSKRTDPAVEPQYSELWMLLLSELLGLCTDFRREVRGGAISTLFRTLQLYGATLSGEIWHQCLWQIVFPVLENITAAMRSPAAAVAEVDNDLDPVTSVDAWSESKILALSSVGSIMNDFLTTKIMTLESFAKAWEVFVGHICDSVLGDHWAVSTAALRSLEKSIQAGNLAHFETFNSQGGTLWTQAWSAIDSIGSAVVSSARPTKSRTPATPRAASEMVQPPPFTQECLLALLDVLLATRSASKKFEHGQEWPLDQLTRMMVVLKAVLTYQSSPDYRPDIDALSPVQANIFKVLESLDLTVPLSPSLVLRDLAEYATLPFLAGFDFEPPTMTSDASVIKTKTTKRVSYIAVSKRAMPWLVELYLQFEDMSQIYADGTLEAVVAAYSIPIKLKYDCPPPSKFGKDPPLWKTATTNFLCVVKSCCPRIKVMAENISDEHVESLWRQVIDVFRGGLLADTTITESLPLDIQNAEENFDQQLVIALETDVVPHIADARVPDPVIVDLAKVLHRASHLHEVDDVPLTPPTDALIRSQTRKPVSVLAGDRAVIGSTVPGKLLPRERWSYWCFDLLFLLCSGVNTDNKAARQRLTVLALPQLIRRCQKVLTSYVADDALRGNMPFPRAREEEILHTLRKLLDLKLWPGAFLAAYAPLPSEAALSLPAIDASLPPSKLIAEAIKRSNRAHLFHLYPVLCDIAAIPRKSVSVWTAAFAPVALNGSDTESSLGGAIAKLLDARQLARAALEEVGLEMGLNVET
ncbi:hypothetical protein BKA62DRAFT_706688 [Auriculariales sp. MPI-PUGE-AT-0066]|nr:hypothetical protein BKA62DRAFT_706688 [Auriculariales sp. MPI-PUGE-AT-0066]